MAAVVVVDVLFQDHRRLVILLGVALVSRQAVRRVDPVHEGPDLVEVLLLLGHARGRAGRVPEVVALRLVLLHVPIEIRLLAKGAVAELAAEGPLLVVDIPHVPLQVRGDAEGPIAVLARIRLLAGVRPQVPREIGRAGNTLPQNLQV